MEHGIITTVRYRDGVVRCDVQPIRATSDYKDVPVMKTFGGMQKTPKPGQKVAMEKLDTGRRFIMGYVTTDSSLKYPDDYTLKPEEMVIQVDDKTIVELRKSDGGENYDLNIQASGDINVEAPKDGDINVHGKDNEVHVESNTPGNVFIDGIDFDEHTHDYDDETINDTGDGSGNSSTATRTTDPPQ